MNTDPGHAEMVEDSKDNIISNVRQAIAKRKFILAMREISSQFLTLGGAFSQDVILVVC